MTDDVEVEFRRVDHLFPCPECGKAAVDHPMGGPLGWQDVQFLHRLCDGSLVKT